MIELENAKKSPSASLVPNFIGGKFSAAEGFETVPVHNPSTAEIIALTPLCGEKEVDEAVKAAEKAFRSWSRTPPMARCSILFRFRQLMDEHFEELADLVTRENGKTKEEARGDVRRGIEVIEFACGIPHMLKGEALPQVSDGLDGITTREPIGVCAGITPYNFPAMVPLWMYPLAIGCGNTFILKPSEKVPLSVVRQAELLQQAGLPDGVFNIVQGGRDVVDALLTHPEIAAVSFVGSTAVAHHVYSLGCAKGKRVQAAGGAKNVLVVMPDADPDSTLKAVIGAAFGCAGQRCMAGSLLLPVGDDPAFRTRLVEAIENLVVDDTTKNEHAGMGPLIDQIAQERVGGWIARAEKDEAKIARDGRGRTPAKGFFVGPTLIESVRPGMAIFDEEVFGPVLSMSQPKDLDEAIQLAYKSGYGNGASIFTTSGSSARHFAREIPCGMVGINVGVPAPMALFAFSGWRNSFYGDLHVQGTEGVLFYTRQKAVLSRWDSKGERKLGW
ncbi:MAG TPA: CoA-acylating methylmalonate-semialdehyde dehydrogenase [Fimbriimonadaceae bacterium]|jgi:malonate-semialdehyde dehydrogenase (acetylating)/methylmalonate-semialdehyde dehydrogenase